MVCESLPHSFGKRGVYKENFFKYSLDGINLQEIRRMLQELQEANQKRDEIKNNVRQVDQNAEVWRYLIRMDDSLYFTCGHSIDYTILKDGINHFLHESVNNA